MSSVGGDLRDLLPQRPAKPRHEGVTAIIDFGPGASGWTTGQALGDFLSIAADFIDLAKIYALNSLLLPREPLRRTVAAYRDARIDVYAGGILFEFACQHGMVERLPELLADLGIPSAEVSENYLSLSPDERKRHIEKLVAAGLGVVYEFGRKRPEEPFAPEDLEAMVASMGDLGVDHVIVEQSEIDLIEASAPGSVVDLARQDWFSNILIECDPNRFPEQHAGLVGGIGSTVNLANVTASQVLGLECIRRGIGRPVDYALITNPEKFQMRAR